MLLADAKADPGSCRSRHRTYNNPAEAGLFTIPECGGDTSDGGSPSLAADKPSALGRRRTTQCQDYQTSLVARWTPETSKNQASWLVIIISAFANIGPVGCLVVSKPAAGIAGSLACFAIFGACSLYGAHLIAGAMAISGCNTLGEMWKVSIGPRTAFLPMVCIAVSCFAICVGYADMYGHLFADVWPVNFPRVFLSSQNFWVVMLGIFPLLFLVMLKDVSVMWYSTIIAGLSCLFTVLVVAVRFLDHSYQLGHYAQWPMPGGEGSHRSKPIYNYHERQVQLFNMEGVLFLMHFNAAKYFREADYSSKERYTVGVGVAMGMGFIVVAITMILILSTFGDGLEHMTLDNYARDDSLARVARIALGLGLLGCFPLLFAAMREAVVELFCHWCPRWQTIFETIIFQNILSAVVLFMVIAVSNASHKIDVMAISFGRCMFGALLIYVIPGVVWVATHNYFVLFGKISVLRKLSIAGLVTLGLFFVVMSPLVWLTHMRSKWGTMGAYSDWSQGSGEGVALQQLSQTHVPPLHHQHHQWGGHHFALAP